VVCVGDIMVDVIARLPRPLALGSDTPAPIEVFGGGSAANTASWLDHLGVPVTLVGRVGRPDDPFRAAALRGLSAAVQRGLVTDQSRPTGRCLVLVGPDGERTMVPDAGANAALTAADVDQGHLLPGRHLHLSGYVLFGPAHEAGRQALRLARRAGDTVSVDAASADPLTRLGPDTFLDWIGRDLLVFANAAEARVLTGRADPRRAALDLARRLGRAVVKCGPAGAIAAGPDGLTEVPTDPVSAVSTTGAGDAFAAGVLDALGRGADTRAALGAGHALAAMACRRLGGRA
jgi:sugar/nucleoside kinase (ribokinase family)